MATVTVIAATMTVMIVTETVAVTAAVTEVVIAWETAMETDTVTGVSATGMAAVPAARIMDASDTARMNLGMMTLALGEGTKHWLSSWALSLFIVPGLPVCITDLPSSHDSSFARVIG
jgi:hypothetical protein